MRFPPEILIPRNALTLRQSGIPHRRVDNDAVFEAPGGRVIVFALATGAWREGDVEQRGGAEAFVRWYKREFPS